MTTFRDLDEVCGHCGHMREVHDFLCCSMRRCRCAQFVAVKKGEDK